MRPLSARDILRIWERGEGQHPVDRALTILAAGCPELPSEALAALPIGERDTRLVELRMRTFGDAIEGRRECPACAEAIELAVPGRAIVEGGGAGDLGGGAGQEIKLQVDGMDLSLRLLNSHDLAAAAACGSVAEARRTLRRRAVVSASSGGAPAPGFELSKEAEELVGVCLYEADPNAEILIEVACPRCAHRFELLFDVVSFFWAEIAAQARRLLYEVHALARAYGWSEAEILSMTPRRRGAYLERVDV